MSVTAAVVLFAMIWFLVFFCVLPLRYRSQAEAGEVVQGTPRSAPAMPMVARKARITTAVTFGIWAVVCLVIWKGWIGIDDFDWTDLIVEPPVQSQPGN